MSDAERDPEALLREPFGHGAFRPGQREVIDLLRGGGRALAVFPTGGGKSLCYQLPALMFAGATIVVSPLLSLMKDQIDALLARGIAAARLDSTLAPAEAFAVQDRLVSGDLKLLFVAPERFSNERFLGLLRRVRIALFAVDEAHCISEWGHNFRPDYLKLAETAREVGAERVLALTATATPEVVRDICAAFGIPDDAAVVTGFYRPNLRLLATPVAAGARDALLLARLTARPPGATIVYVTLQRTAERVARDLSGAGLSAEAYHAGMDDAEREAVQDRWRASDRRIVVATIAFGMGIDKADVRYVYHYNLPKGLESYSQEIGRAGRDGKPSIVEMLACPDDLPTLENFAHGDVPTERAVRGLVEEVLAGPSEIDGDLYGLSGRHDIRLLVVRTALVYLELLGYLREGTPFYAGYEVRPFMPVPEIVAKFEGEPSRLVSDLFARAKKGKIWYRLDVADAAEALGQERRRIVRALDYLAEHGWAEVRAVDLRRRYTRLRAPDDPAVLAGELMGRFLRREEREVARLREVLDLVTHDGCQTNALVGHFGETRTEPCGHCGYCVTGRRTLLPEAEGRRPVPAGLDVVAFQALREAHPDALGEPRQGARFLAGLTSPALTRAKLSRHALFGALEERRFQEILAWCESME